VPPLSICTLRETLSRRRHFVRLKTAEVNAAKRLLRASGRGGDARSLGSRVAWDLLLVRIRDDARLRACVELHRQTWRHADNQVHLLDERLVEQSREYDTAIDLLRTIPGVGRIVALTAVAVYGDVSRFPGAKQAASYAGLVPSTHQSGDRDTHGHITKGGSAELRAMLCEAAQHARRKDHPLHPFFISVCVKRGYKVAMVSVAHRLARIIFAMLRDRTRFDDRIAGVEHGPFTYAGTVEYRRAAR
jgi:transposase